MPWWPPATGGRDVRRWRPAGRRSVELLHQSEQLLVGRGVQIEALRAGVTARAVLGRPGFEEQPAQPRDIAARGCRVGDEGADPAFEVTGLRCRAGGLRRLGYEPGRQERGTAAGEGWSKTIAAGS